MNRAVTERGKLRGWRLTRQQARDARRKLRTTGDIGAAELLLRHSIAYGHNRLIVRRLLLARALGLDLCEYERFCRSAIEQLDVNELGSVLSDVRSFMTRLKAKGARQRAVRQHAVRAALDGEPAPQRPP